jgi:hypothetical protein
MQVYRTPFDRWVQRFVRTNQYLLNSKKPCHR